RGGSQSAAEPLHGGGTGPGVRRRRLQRPFCPGARRPKGSQRALQSFVGPYSGAVDFGIQFFERSGKGGISGSAEPVYPELYGQKGGGLFPGPERLQQGYPGTPAKLGPIPALCHPTGLCGGNPQPGRDSRGSPGFQIPGKILPGYPIWILQCGGPGRRPRGPDLQEAVVPQGGDLSQGTVSGLQGLPGRGGPKGRATDYFDQETITIQTMRTIFVIAALLQGIVLSGQTAVEFGVLTPFEREFETYEKDSTAHAVYLYERGDSYFEVQDRHIWLIKKYHAKKKILDQRGFSQAEVVIPYYHSDNRSERVTNLRAMTHNGTLRHSVMPEQVFEVDENEFWSMKKFTFPKVEVGSILEYTYEIRSPYIFNLRGWSFQDGIPKVLSEFHAKIPGNYKYNRTLIGELALDVDEATLEKSCFYLPGTSSNPADREVLTYTMKDVPAFEHDGEYMLSANNYRSRLDFELSEYQGFDGTIQKFTKTWEDVDREFKADKDIGGQLGKKNYFEKRVPEDLLE